MSHPFLCKAVAALGEIGEPPLDRPAWPAAAKFHPRRVAFMQPHRREEARLAAQGLQHRARHDMRVGVDDHRFFVSGGGSAPTLLRGAACLYFRAPAPRNLTAVASALLAFPTVNSAVVRVCTRPVAEAASDRALAATASGASAMMTTSCSPSA